jgi:mediator of RNA polymerase II transcription subunit 5
MAFVYRYDLTYHDIGIGANTFMARVITKGHHSILPDDMTAEQNKHLGNWLKGLFDTGNEGLSNDVFASCRPQDFYVIAPTLFQQIVLALSHGILSFDTVKGGLECKVPLLFSLEAPRANQTIDLGETFLLPSLIGGLTWMSSYALLQTHTDLDAMMRIFHEIILSAHSSGDAKAMHAAILAMVSSRLEKCFRTLQRRDASRANNIEPLLQALKGNLHYERSMYASMKELEQWTNAPNSTLNSVVQHTVEQLTQWASTVAIQPNPPSYTHRQIYNSVKILGAYETLRAIVNEVKAQTEAGNGAAVLDIAASIICSPAHEDSPIPVHWVGSTIPAPPRPRTRQNMRELLKDSFDNAAHLVATDPLTAESIVRLYRRVEAQVASMGETTLQSQGPVLSLPGVHLAGMQAQNMSDDINKAIDDAAAASIVEDITDMDNKALQRSMEELTGPEGLDLSSIGIGTGDAGTADMGADLGNLDLTDMGGLDLDMDMDMTMTGGGDDDWGLDFENM